jgi:hypothetical protein
MVKEKGQNDNDLQNTTQKTKDGETRTPLKPLYGFSRNIRIYIPSITPPLFIGMSVPKPREGVVVYVSWGIDFTHFCYFSILFWKCPDGVVFFLNILPSLHLLLMVLSGHIHI